MTGGGVSMIELLYYPAMLGLYGCAVIVAWWRGMKRGGFLS